MQGKGGGKAENAQASGTNIASKDEIISKAKKYAEDILQSVPETPKVSSGSGAILHCPSNSQVKLRSMISAVYSGKTLSIVEDSKTFFREGNVELTNSTAITYHLASISMKGSNPHTEAQVLQWLSYSDNHIQPAVASWVHLYVGNPIPQISPVTAKEEVLKVLRYLDTVLLTRTYFVGERISLADIVVFTSLLPAYIHVLDLETKNPFLNVNRWFDTILHQPQVSKVVGSVKLCEKPPKIKKSGAKNDTKNK